MYLAQIQCLFNRTGCDEFEDGDVTPLSQAEVIAVRKRVVSLVPLRIENNDDVDACEVEICKVHTKNIPQSHKI